MFRSTHETILAEHLKVLDRALDRNDSMLLRVEQAISGQSRAEDYTERVARTMAAIRRDSLARYGGA